MAITGRTPDECFDRFLDHVRPLVAEMVPTKCPMRCPRPGKGLPTDRRTLSFANDQHDDAVALETRFGTAYLYMTQELRVVQEDRRQYRLRTTSYGYKLYAESPALETESIIRWEYEPAKAGHRGPCRHHVQFGKMVVPVPFGSGAFDFTRFHMPTGWVLMEEVFRFLVTELDMKPPCGARWPDVLRASEDAFYKGFTDKGASGY